MKAKADEAAFLESEARDRREELEQITVPMPPQLIADDVTSEALGRLLYDHRERMAVFSAEGDLFEIMAGRYSDGSGNFAVYLKGHAGDMLKVNRVGRPPDYVRHPALTLAITAQPRCSKGWPGRTGSEGRGCWPGPSMRCRSSLVGRRDRRRRRCPSRSRTRYGRPSGNCWRSTNRSSAIEAEPTTVPEPTRLRFDHAAEARLVAFMDGLGAATRAGWRPLPRRRLGREAGRPRRAGGRPAPPRRPVGRSRAGSEQVSAETVERAIAFGDYALGHALAAFGAMGADPATGGARRLWRWIAERGEPTVRRADAYQALRGQFPKSADLDAPFALLVEYGYLRRRSGRRSARGGAARPARAPAERDLRREPARADPGR